ncbi:MAG: MlaD family protein [Armatimonadota bacterium]
MTISNELRVGIMFLTGLILLVLMVVTLSRWGQATKTYSFTIRFQMAQGLKEGAGVQVAGVEVGRVTRIELDPKNNDALVTVQVDRRVRLYHGYTFALGVGGIVGERYVDIVPREREPYGMVVSGNTEVTGKDRPDMNQLVDNANDLVTKLTAATDSLNDIIGSDQNKHNLTAAITNLSLATASAADFTKQLNGAMGRNKLAIDASIVNVQRTTQSAAVFADSMNLLMARNQHEVDETIASIRQGSINAAEFTAAMNETMQRNQQVIDLIIANLGKSSNSAVELTTALNATVQNNQQAVDLIVANMQTVTTDLKELTTTLNTKVAKSDMFDNLETATRRSVDIADRLESIANAVSTLLNDKEMTDSVRESVSNLRQASEDMQTLMADARDAAAPFPEMTASLREVTNDMRKITGSVSEITPEASQHILQITRNLRTTSDSLSGTTTQLVRFGKVLKDTKVQTQAQLMALVSGDPDTRADLNMDILGANTMLRLGLANVGYGDRLNLQFGNRLGKDNWFRYGLVQSSFGAGADWRPNDRWTLTGELFAPGDIRGNATVSHQPRFLGDDWWLTGGVYDLFHSDTTSAGIGMTYRPK